MSVVFEGQTLAQLYLLFVCSPLLFLSLFSLCPLSANSPQWQRVWTQSHICTPHSLRMFVWSAMERSMGQTMLHLFCTSGFGVPLFSRNFITLINNTITVHVFMLQNSGLLFHDGSYRWLFILWYCCILSSGLDYCNSLFMNLSKSPTKKAQNAADQLT